MADAVKEPVELVLRDCRISKRGKGARGTVEVRTFGIPQLDENGIAKDWDYSPFLSMPVRDAIDAIECQSRKVNPVLAALIGHDKIVMSEGLQSSSEVALVAAMILEAGLAIDETYAENLAKKWHKHRNDSIAFGSLVWGWEDYMESQRKIVNALIAKGEWNPILVDNRPSESENSDSNTDSE